MLFVLDEVATFCENTKEIWQLVGRAINIMQIVIPVALVGWGLFDLFKAMLSGDEKERKEALGTFAKRVLYGLLVLFIVSIVKGVIGLANKGDSLNTTCWKCVTDPKKC